MKSVRRALGPIAAAWLICQTATLACATVAFAVTGDAAALLECTCAHGADHTTCPMHHPANPSRPGLCRIECAGEADLSVLASLLGQLGVTPSVEAAPVSPPPPAVTPHVVTAHILRPEPPDPPPPRV